MQFTDMSRHYMASDYELMIDICKSEINFLKSSWQNMLGRPLVTIACRSVHLGILSICLMWFDNIKTTAFEATAKISGWCVLFVGITDWELILLIFNLIKLIFILMVEQISFNLIWLLYCASQLFYNLQISDKHFSLSKKSSSCIFVVVVCKRFSIFRTLWDNSFIFKR